MKKAISILCVIAVFTVLLSACSGGCGQEEPILTSDPVIIDKEQAPREAYPIITHEGTYKEQEPVMDTVIINKVHVTEQPLSEIVTDESDRFARSYNRSQPYLDDYDMYYNKVHMGDSAVDYLYCDNGTSEAKDAGLPELSCFTVGSIIDGAIYGMERDPYGDYWVQYLTVYKDGKGKRLVEEPVLGCYFAEEGIYYQCDDKIMLMDYSGENSRQYTEIPVELYAPSILSKFIIYRGKLWYAYDDHSKNHYYPLWCLDSDGIFTRFDRGGIDTVNNGFIYYKEPYPDNRLFRFNCETYTVEPVCEIDSINDYTFFDNYIFYTAFNSTGTLENLYRMNTEENKKILSPKALRKSEGIYMVSCTDDRLFATGYSGLFYTCLAEIDVNGRVIQIIHEDESW